MIDIHNHLMYGVDDGSKNLEETLKLLELSKLQGIKSIFLTPHVNSKMSFASREIHNKRFEEIKLYANKYDLDIYLGAEIYISFRLPEIDFSKYVMGHSNFLLLEFSTYHKTPIVDHAYNLIRRGFKIIIAHVERYEYLEINDILELRDMGVLFQVNSSSLLNSSKNQFKKKSRNYIKKGLIDFVASDSHGLYTRPSTLKSAYKFLMKYVGKREADLLLFDNQIKHLISV